MPLARIKKSATPRGCAKFPPKEEVLEELRRHLRRCPTQRHYEQSKSSMQVFMLLCNKFLQKNGLHLKIN